MGEKQSISSGNHCGNNDSFCNKKLEIEHMKYIRMMKSSAQKDFIHSWSGKDD